MTDQLLSAPPRRYAYVSDGAEIYRESFATIRAEADLTALPRGRAQRGGPDGARLR